MSCFREKHHYVSQSYLKAWSDECKNLWVYRILVSDDSVPLWQKRSIKSVAYHKHLYTGVAGSADSDELERWMDQKIEAPAQEVLCKIHSDKALTQGEWGHLLRFVALQDVRTPVRFIEHMEFMKKQMPKIMEEELKNGVRRLANARKTAQRIETKAHPDSNMIPLRLTKKIEPGAEQGFLKAEVIVGRSTWLFMIRHVLTKAYKVLKKHRWSIIKAPKGIEWPTSDNPVVKLNYYASGSYDFKGGWGNEGTEILFPLSPYLLLYTKVGDETQHREISMQLAMMLQHIVAEHAHRFVFSSRPIKTIERLRPRVVDREAFRYERETWEKWHDAQKNAELALTEREEEEEAPEKR